MAQRIDGRHGARHVLIVCALLAGAAAVGYPQGITVTLDEVPWPRTVQSGSARLTVYPLQIDAWDGFKLSARCAVKVEAPRGSSPRFGVVTIDARTLTDKSTRLVVLDRAQVTGAKFPTADPADARRWSASVARDLTDAARPIALDRLEAALAATEVALTGAQQPLGVGPPRIIFSSRPAVLVYVDGDPQYRAFADTPLQRVVNTRMLILRDTRGVNYLRIFDGWMRASSLDGTWTVASDPPDALDVALGKAREARLVDELTGRSVPGERIPSLRKTVPTIYVATAPTELIVTDGPQNWTMVDGLRVFYLLNTTGRVLKSGEDFNTYVLAAGRWFRARHLTGPWTYVPANALPRDFARIPDSSPIENVKASIAGTHQAREAAIAAMIPQTVALTVHGTQITAPQFDGDPSFKPIDGTQLEYVANSATPIIRVGGDTVYAVENGVWFMASSIASPWSVATSVPAEIYSIPPTSPLFYVTFARVYATAADIVFVGYTPGYHGTYVDSTTGVVVYGTGYTYSSWAEREWYGGPVTYGFGAAPTYTPWTGWVIALGLGWAWGNDVLADTWGWGPYPWWGPWGWGWAYGPPSYPWYPVWGATSVAVGEAVAWGPGGWTAYSGDIYRRWDGRVAGSRLGVGASAWTENAWIQQVGFSYNSRTGVATTGQHGAIENLNDVSYATRSRDVAVTTSGAIISARLEVIGNLPAEHIVYIGGERRPASEGGVTRVASGTVGPIEDDIYAGRDGNVYRRVNGNWQRRTADGWRVISDHRDLTAQLDLECAMRELGERRAVALRESSFNMRRSFAEWGAVRPR